MDLVESTSKRNSLTERVRARRLAERLKFYAWAQLTAISLVGHKILEKGYLDAPGEVPLNSALYPMLYYILAELTDTDKKFRGYFIRAYVANKAFREGTNYILTLLEREDELIKDHPAVRMVSEYFSMKKLVERLKAFKI
jgi:hypothetical protein